MAELLNVSQVAELLKTSRVSVYNAIRDGALTPARREKSGPKFDAATVVEQWEARAMYTRLQSNHDGVQNKGGRPRKDAPENAAGDRDVNDGAVFGDLRKGTPHEKLVKAKLADTVLRAKHREVDLQRKKGALIPVETVRNQGAELGSVLMGSLSALPDRLSQVLAAMTDPHEVHETLENEIDAMIKTIRERCGMTEEEAGEPAAKAGAETD